MSLVKKKRREERRRRLLLFNLDSSVKRPYRTIRLSYWAFLKLERPIELQKLERAKKRRKKDSPISRPALVLIRRRIGGIK